MSNQQIRLLVSVLVVLSGAIAANASQVDVNVGIFLILVGVVMLFTEYFRSLRIGD